MVVTFCGATFDLPAIERSFSGFKFDQIHIDLCPVLRKLGYRGGLKRIEKELGIRRPDEVDGLTGFDAVILWRKYRAFYDDAALRTLIAYNREDVMNLERLAEVAYRQMTDATLSASS